MADRRPELYLVIESGPTAAERLRSILARWPIASVLIRAPAGARLESRPTQGLVELAQMHGAAVLIADDAPLARSLAADGVHLSSGRNELSDYAAARSILGSSAIVGIESGRSRHHAMELAEAGADYIAFTDPGDDRRAPESDRQHAIVAWWAETFEVPCVAFDVTSAEAAAAFAVCGAEFVAVPIDATCSVSRSVDQVSVVAEAIGRGARDGGLS